MHSQKFALFVDSLRRLVRRGAKANILNMTAKVHLADVAHAFTHLNARERGMLFSIIYSADFDRAAEVFGYLDYDVALELLEAMEPEQCSRLFEKLDSEDAAAFLSELPEEKSGRILELMKDKESDRVEEHLGYADETAGRIMHTQFFSLAEETSVQDAVAALQESSGELEMVFYLYVTDDRGHLVGVVSLRQLLINKPTTKLRGIMTTDVIKVSTETDQEEVARLTAKYDLLAVPVTDESNRLVGIITVDDVIDIMKEEATEDFFRLAGTSEEELLEQSSFRVARFRIPWLFGAMLGGLLSGWLLKHSLERLGEIIAIASFVPIIMGMGGNAGTQSSAITVRALALGRISFKNLAGRLFKELRTGLIMGVACGALTGGVAYLWYGRSYLGVIVGLSLVSCITVAAVMGTLIPMTFKRLKIDPAMASGPFVTASNDITGLLIYFALATALLRLFH